jgi:hypothetical protein
MSQVFPTLTVLGGGAALQAQFYTPIRLNAVTATRLIVGGLNSVYESLDQGDTITEIGPGITVGDLESNPIAYGAVANPDILYVGSGSRVLVRTGASPAALAASAAYPGTQRVTGIAIDPNDPQIAYAADTSNVYRTTNAGTTWAAITGNLLTLNPGTLRSIVYITGTTDGAVVASSDTGVFSAAGPTFTSWNPLGTGLPRAPVYQLDYKHADGTLLAGTLGRGAWVLKPSFRGPCQRRPEFCHGIYDPWWWLKCPACRINIFINPGDDFRQITVFDSLGKQVGKVQRLEVPVVEKGVKYSFRITLKPQKGIGYVFMAEMAPGKEIKGSFKPAYIVRSIKTVPSAR